MFCIALKNCLYSITGNNLFQHYSPGVSTICTVPEQIPHSFFKLQLAQCGSEARGDWRPRWKICNDHEQQERTDTGLYRQFKSINQFLADRTATQYDRLLASSCCPSVCLSVCDAVHCDSQGWCTGLKVAPACYTQYDRLSPCCPSVCLSVCL